MELLTSAFTWTLILVFISTAASKIIAFKSFHTKVQTIIKRNGMITKITAMAAVTGESFVSISLLLSIQRRAGVVLAVILLVIYSIAVLNNLIERNTEMDCGCGGILGNHRMSYLLILRNVALIGMVVTTFNHTFFPFNDLYGLFLSLLIAFVILLMLATLSKIGDMNGEYKSLTGDDAHGQF
ncbi:MauE/DoxX family redox-associated membrane protein [Sediminibacillus halophilus]|uniref:Methylamine utilisation protein MauE n=1 Tax=Sediminibacillus halophilus TaxID=482461 RepID=A0A1G9VA23_9BACI|nr:MauE/DoxX family redox-associated membrane protein [Sediminibacillus halophilus]SDM68933.1 Methylamine utilisation protein MauE [Sediminibacillus halophilus]